MYIGDEELIDAYRHIDAEYRPMFKLLTFSGVRLKQMYYGFAHVDIVVEKNGIARIPISSEARGNKKAFWIVIPSDFLQELQHTELSHNYHTYVKKIRYGRVTAKTLRNWNFNFLLENDVSESIADFIQGRSSVTVGSSHYMNKTRHADRAYQKISEKMKNLFI
jgi:intergrase/recombinase